ncbi:MAG: hypothetical protein JXA81_10695 [Sedimentisphaerales bacterium]|nr:hypothetical protein [Sedimentisphaerales bacterium]
MRYLTYCLLMMVLVGAYIILVSCKQQTSQEPPLLGQQVDKEPLLLLEDSNRDENPDIDTGKLADNSRCYVCHMNYEVDELTSIHAKADIGCERCHGASDAHCSDEDNIMPPDIMYPAEKVNSFCKSCHPDGKLSGGKKFCTDCHGEHRLSHRTRKWDKATGKLIEDGEVRMPTEQ